MSLPLGWGDWCRCWACTGGRPVIAVGDPQGGIRCWKGALYVQLHPCFGCWLSVPA